MNNNRPPKSATSAATGPVAVNAGPSVDPLVHSTHPQQLSSKWQDFYAPSREGTRVPSPATQAQTESRTTPRGDANHRNESMAGHMSAGDGAEPAGTTDLRSLVVRRCTCRFVRGCSAELQLIADHHHDRLCYEPATPRTFMNDWWSSART